MPTDAPPSDEPFRTEPGPPTFTGLHERARRVGQYVWIEQRLFEILGAWSAVTPEPGVAVMFGELSRRHGWHAAWFRERLPDLSSVDTEALVVSPGPATEGLLDAAGADGERAHTLEHLVGIHRVVLPMLLTEYRRVLERTAVASDASLARWLRLIIDDDLDEWARGEAAIRSMLVDRAAVSRSTAVQGELELLAIASVSLTR